MGSGSSSKSKKLDLQDDGGAAAHPAADRPVSPNHLLRPAGASPRKCSKNAGGGHQESDGSRNPSKVRISDTVEYGLEGDSMVRKPILKSPHGIHPPGLGLHITASAPQNRVPSKLSPYVTSDHTGPSGDRHGHHGHHRQADSGDLERPPPRIVFVDKETEDLVNDIENGFPVDEFEMTLYAALPRFRPGETITLQDFKEKKTLNDVKGKCMDHDGRLHVWTILLEDGRKMRVVPTALQKALQNPDVDKGGKPVEGYVTYGTDMVAVVLDTEHVNVHRHVKEHIPRPKILQKEEQVVHDDAEPRAKAKRKAKKKKTLDAEAPQEQEKEVVRPFEVGDMVTMKDAGGARLGLGKIKELGEMRNDHRMLKVEFGQRGGVYNLEDTELMLSTATKRA